MRLMGMVMASGRISMCSARPLRLITGSSAAVRQEEGRKCGKRLVERGKEKAGGD